MQRRYSSRNRPLIVATKCAYPNYLDDTGCRGLTGVRSAGRLFGMNSPTEIINWLQWPAMVVTVAAAWMVASQRKFKRNWGFWLFLLSNMLWIVWGAVDRAYALIALQFALAALNIRGAMKNQT